MNTKECCKKITILDGKECYSDLNPEKIPNQKDKEIYYASVKAIQEIEKNNPDLVKRAGIYISNKPDFPPAGIYAPVQTPDIPCDPGFYMPIDPIDKQNSVPVVFPELKLDRFTDLF